VHQIEKSDHILGDVSKIENLNIIDTGSGTSVKKIREMMGKKFEINLFPPVELLLKELPREDILKWLDQSLRENQSGFIKFAYHLD